MIVFDADDPLVLNNTYDVHGYKPGERARITKGQTDMAKKTAARGRLVKNGKTVAHAKNAALPGMEDHAIEPLEDIAAEYAGIRDQRMELGRQEHILKANALKLMKKYSKTIYKHGGVTIQVVEGEPDVKVKVKKPGEDDDDAESGGEFAAARRAAVNED